MTTDQGTERILSTFGKVPLDDLVPWAKSCVDTLMQHGGAQGCDDGPEVSANVVAQHMVDTSSCLNFPGVLHVIHLVTRDLKNSVPEFSKFVDDLTQVSRLLSKKHYFQRFLSTCCNPQGDERAGLFRSAFTTRSLTSLRVFEGRWGSVANSIIQLGSLEGALRATWSREKFGFGKVTTTTAKAVNISIVDAAIQSDYFWLLRAAFQVISECLVRAMHWAESCPCHAHHGLLSGVKVLKV